MIDALKWLEFASLPFSSSNVLEILTTITKSHIFGRRRPPRLSICLFAKLIAFNTVEFPLASPTFEEKSHKKLFEIGSFDESTLIIDTFLCL